MIPPHLIDTAKRAWPFNLRWTAENSKGEDFELDVPRGSTLGARAFRSWVDDLAANPEALPIVLRAIDQDNGDQIASGRIFKGRRATLVPLASGPGLDIGGARSGTERAAAFAMRDPTHAKAAVGTLAEALVEGVGSLVDRWRARQARKAAQAEQPAEPEE